MKKLSDYTGEEAIELWADILGPAAKILSDKEIAKKYRSQSVIDTVKYILKNHKQEAVEILLRIDDTPIDAINIVSRILNLINEIKDREEVKDFFGSAEQETMANVSSGSATENIVAEKN